MRIGTDLGWTRERSLVLLYMMSFDRQEADRLRARAMIYREMKIPTDARHWVRSLERRERWINELNNYFEEIGL